MRALGLGVGVPLWYQGPMRFRPRAGTSFAGILLAALLVWVAVQAMRRPQAEFGDGREYVLQTQAIVLDRSLAVDPARRAPYWNATNPYGIQLNAGPEARPGSDALGEARQFGGGFGSLYLDRRGGFRYIHSWAYSMAVAPIYALLHRLAPGGSEYYAFRVANIILLVVPLLILWGRRPSLGSLAFIVVMLASPITPHLQFAHSEIFCLSCILMAFALVELPAWRLVSPIFLGLGAAQNVPIALLFPLHLLLFVEREGGLRAVLRARSGARLAAAYALGGSLAIGMLLYNREVFGTFSLIAELGQADVRFLSWRKMASVFCSPIIGAAWYLPASWLAVLLAAQRGRGWTAVPFVISVLLAATLSSTTANINSAQVSACRYAVWYLGPLYVLAFLPERGSGGRGGSKALGIIGAVIVALLWWWLGLWRLLLGESQGYLSTQRAVPEVAALYRLTHFHDDVEPLVENISGRELQVAFHFWGVYVWNLGEGESLWVISQRALANGGDLEVRTSAVLNELPGVLELFTVTRERGGNYLLKPRPEMTFSRHPFFGGYRLLWIPARIDALRAPGPVTLR